FVPGNVEVPPMATTAVAFGFVLLSSFFTGRIVERFGMPRVTGYLVLGVLAGPYAMNLVTTSMVESLGLVNGVAICLIALTAGGELSFRRMRPLLKTINSMMIYAVMGT